MGTLLEGGNVGSPVRFWSLPQGPLSSVVELFTFNEEVDSSNLSGVTMKKIKYILQQIFLGFLYAEKNKEKSNFGKF